MKSYPLSKIFFSKPVECPGKPSASNVTHTTKMGNKTWDLSYLPELSLYRVVHTPPGKEVGPDTIVRDFNGSVVESSVPLKL